MSLFPYLKVKDLILKANRKPSILDHGTRAKEGLSENRRQDSAGYYPASSEHPASRGESEQRPLVES